MLWGWRGGWDVGEIQGFVDSSSVMAAAPDVGSAFAALGWRSSYLLASCAQPFCCWVALPFPLPLTMFGVSSASVLGAGVVWPLAGGGVSIGGSWVEWLGTGHAWGGDTEVGAGWHRYRVRGAAHGVPLICRSRLIAVSHGGVTFGVGWDRGWVYGVC